LKEFASREPGTSDGSWGQKRAIEISNAKFEVHEGDRIRRQFESETSPAFVEKLRLSVSGPDHYRDEKSDRVATQAARNAMTELAIGAYMKSIGHCVEYGDDQFPEPMVWIGPKEYAVQCKRIATTKANQIGKRIRQAGYQINKNVKDYSDRCSEGIIVIDVSKFINPNGMVLYCPTKHHFSNSEARHNMYSFFNKYLKNWDFSKNMNVSGIIMTASFLITKEPKSVANDFMSHKLIKENSSRSELSEWLHRHDAHESAEYTS